MRAAGAGSGCDVRTGWRHGRRNIPCAAEVGKRPCCHEASQWPPGTARTPAASGQVTASSGRPTAGEPGTGPAEARHRQPVLLMRSLNGRLAGMPRRITYAEGCNRRTAQHRRGVRAWARNAVVADAVPVRGPDVPNAHARAPAPVLCAGAIVRRPALSGAVTPSYRDEIGQSARECASESPTRGPSERVPCPVDHPGHGRCRPAGPLGTPRRIPAPRRNGGTARRPCCRTPCRPRPRTARRLRPGTPPRIRRRTPCRPRARSACRPRGITARGTCHRRRTAGLGARMHARLTRPLPHGPGLTGHCPGVRHP